MGTRTRTPIIAAIRARVADQIIGRDPAELEDADTLAAVYAYTHDALDTEGLPEFGTAAWAVLADDDPRKTHAVTVAALAYLNAAAAARDTPCAGQDVAAAMVRLGIEPRPRDNHAALQRRREALLDKPAKTAAQIRAQARYSWACVERQLGRDTDSRRAA